MSEQQEESNEIPGKIERPMIGWSVVQEQAEQQRSVYGGPGWIPTCADPLAKDPQTRRDARLISAAWPAAVRVGSFIRTLVTTPPEKSLFSPFSPPFETCEENDGGRERCSPLISRRFENVCHVPRPCNTWIVQGVVVCEVECCFDTEGVRRYSSGGGDGRKRCLNYLVRSWQKFALVGTCY